MTGLRFTCASLLLATAAHAQPFPSKPIKIIVPYTAGGVVDVIARSVGERMAQTTGQPNVVENRVGAAGSPPLTACTLSRPRPAS